MTRIWTRTLVSETLGTSDVSVKGKENGEREEGFAEDLCRPWCNGGGDQPG